MFRYVFSAFLVQFIFIMGITAYFFSSLFPKASIWEAIISSPFAFSQYTSELLLIFSLNFLLCGKHANKLRYVFSSHMLFIHLTQFFCIYYSFQLLTTEIFYHAPIANQMVNGFTLFSFVYVLFFYWGACYSLDLIIKKGQFTWRKKLWIVLPNLLVYPLIANGYAYLPWFREIRTNYHVLDQFPTPAFYQELRGVYADFKPAEKTIPLSVKEITTAEQYGIRIADQQYPLVKDYFYNSKLPFAEKRPVENSNIIVFFVESLSSRLTEPYGGAYPNLTPNMLDFAKISMTLKSYYNHAFPTVNGLRGQLCSVFPTFGNAYFRNMKVKYQNKIANNCLPKILNKEGYDSIYMSYAHPNETFFEAQMQEMGFTRSYFYRSFLEKFTFDTEPGHLPYGNSDKQMFAGVARFLKDRSSKKPFFLAVSTIETHPGMDVADPRYKYGDGRSKVLNTFHNFDHFFGKFLEEFKQSEYFANTLLVLTADHAHSSDVEYREVAGEDFPGDLFDPIVMMIYSPFHKLPNEYHAHSTSIDFAPSLLHLLKISNQRNHFLGVSFFGDRQKLKGSLGLIYGSKFLQINGEERKTFDLNLEHCASFRESSEHEECHSYRAIRASQDIIKNNQLWK